MQTMNVHVLSVPTVVTPGTRPEAMSMQVLPVPAVVVPNFVVTAVVTAGRVGMIPRTLATIKHQNWNVFHKSSFQLYVRAERAGREGGLDKTRRRHYPRHCH